MSDHPVIDVDGPPPAEGLCLELVGPLRLRDGAGSDLTPRGRKAQGLLALVGMSPNLRRSRAWVQDKLWSDRSPEQGASSLRQCLAEIRSALGRQVGCFETNRTWIAFDPARVEVRADCGLAADRDTEFLEGLDIRDPEFEHWIRDRRLSYAARHELTYAGDAGAAGLSVAGSRQPGKAPPVVGLVTRCAPGSRAGGLLADQMVDLVAAALLDRLTVDLVDLRSQPQLGSSPEGCGPDWLLCTAASMWRGRARIALTLNEAGAARLRWAEARVFDVDAFYGRDPAAIEAFARHVADCVATGTKAARPELRAVRTPFTVSGDPFGRDGVPLGPIKRAGGGGARV